MSSPCVALSGQADEGYPPVTATAAHSESAADSLVDLHISGMTCAGCVAGVERALRGVTAEGASVTDVSVNLTGQARVTTDGPIPPAALVAAVQGAGYGATVLAGARVRGADATDGPSSVAGALERIEAQDQGALRSLRRRMIVAIVCAIPVVAMSMVMALQVPGWQVAAWLLTVPIVGWAATGFYQRALAGLRHGTVTMDTLVTIGVITAFSWSTWQVVAGGEPYLEVAAAVPAFLLVGRWIEARARLRATTALRAIGRLAVPEVTVIVGEQTRTVAAATLQVGDVLLIRPGEAIGADGVVIEGQASVDMSLVTGESLPREVRPGDPVTGATLNCDGRLLVRVSAVGEDTLAARIGALILAAQHARSRAQRIADEVAGVFTPIVLIIAAVTAAVWVIAGRPELAVSASIAVLIIACPCALGLATPMAFMVASTAAARQGILLRGPVALERAGPINTVVLDKTGTLTTGSLTVIRTARDPDRSARSRGGLADDEVDSLVAECERGSEHPIGRALAGAASAWQVAAWRALPGQGVAATLRAPRAMGECGADRVHEVRVVRPEPGLPAWAEHAITTAAETGATCAVAWIDGEIRAVYVLADQPTADAAAGVQALRTLGCRTILLTGDSAAAATAVAQRLGLDEVAAEQTPQSKAAAITALQAGGRRVAMVGDGINDAVALATADLGIAMGSGTEIARASADVVLLRSSVTAIAQSLVLARRTDRAIRINLIWAFAYNIALIPVAAVGLLAPMWAGAAMAASSAFVVGNSLRLRGLRGVPRRDILT